MRAIAWTVALLASACIWLLARGPAAVRSGKPIVFAASSLTDVLASIHPDASYNFAGSDQLAAQIRQGATPDVFASAAETHAAALFSEGFLDSPQVFATNRLVLITPKGSNAKAGPAAIKQVSDAARPGLKVLIAEGQVPIGRYTRQFLASAGLDRIMKNIISLEPDARGILSKVAFGEADAGFVYATDAAASTRVNVIELPAAAQPAIRYSIAPGHSSKHPAQAKAFVAEVLSARGRKILESAGFGRP